MTPCWAVPPAAAAPRRALQTLVHADPALSLIYADASRLQQVVRESGVERRQVHAEVGGALHLRLRAAGSGCRTGGWRIPARVSPQ